MAASGTAICCSHCCSVRGLSANAAANFACDMPARLRIARSSLVLVDIKATQSVFFFMKDGKIYRNDRAPGR